MLLAQRPPAFHWRTLRESGGGGERRQEVQKYSQEQGTVVGGQREEIYNGQMGDKSFGDEGGVRVQH